MQTRRLPIILLFLIYFIVYPTILSTSLITSFVNIDNYLLFLYKITSNSNLFPVDYSTVRINADHVNWMTRLGSTYKHAMRHLITTCQSGNHLASLSTCDYNSLYTEVDKVHVANIICRVDRCRFYIACVAFFATSN